MANGAYCSFTHRWNGGHSSLKFVHPGDSHKHSLQILNQLYEYDDFMQSIRTMVDLGCGTGEDLEWWASRTTRDDEPQPLNIKCIGVDKERQLTLSGKYANIGFQKKDFENEVNSSNHKFDLLWCHDAFQYAVNPMGTLKHWWDIATPGAMLVISVPDTLAIQQKQLCFELPSGCFYHHTVVSLMYMLAVNGWDCGAGFFKKQNQDPWIHAIVYKSNVPPMNPKTTSWYDLAQSSLLSETAIKSINAHGRLRQQDLVVTWIDKSLSYLGK